MATRRHFPVFQQLCFNQILTDRYELLPWVGSVNQVCHVLKPDEQEINVTIGQTNPTRTALV